MYDPEEWDWEPVMGQQHHNELLDMEGEEKGLTGVGMESLFKGGGGEGLGSGGQGVHPHRWCRPPP